MSLTRIVGARPGVVRAPDEEMVCVGRKSPGTLKGPLEVRTVVDPLKNILRYLLLVMETT